MCEPTLKSTLPSSGEPLNVRVRQTPGGPRIHVNGEPIPPRFFAGFLGGSLRTADKWRTVFFEFGLPRGDSEAASGIVRIRFNTACEFLLSDIRVTDCETGAETLPEGSFASEPAFANAWEMLRDEKPSRPEPTVDAAWTPEAVRIRLAGEVSGWWPTFRLENRPGSLELLPGHRYRCEFRVRSSRRGVVNVTVLKQAGDQRVQIGEPASELFASQFRMARKAGIRLCHVQMPTCFTPPEVEQDWEPLDRYFRRVIDIVPDALIVPRIEADAPAWWCERHPDAVMLFEDGHRGRKCTVSSREYRRDMAAHFEKLCRHLSEAFPDNFAGLLPLGQGTYEWYYEESQGLLLSGYNPVVEKAWRDWLASRKIAGARSATVPSPDRRHGAPNGALRDPSTEAELIEFARFRQAEMADAVLEIAAACRRGTNNGKLVMIFYGYLFEFAMMRTGVSESGHYALSRILEHDAVDILCAPLSYTDRMLGGSLPCMSAAESVQNSGVLWLNEDDCRTCFAGTSSLGGVDTLGKSIEILRRSRGQAIVRGFADWWLDIRDMGWHDAPEMWEIQHQMNPVEPLRLEKQEPFSPEILAIVDEDSMLHLSGQSFALAKPLIYDSRAAFGRCGAPYGQARLDDVATGRLRARLQVFLGCWAPTESQRKALHRGRGAGVTRVWCHAPGLIGPDGFSPDEVRDLTTFRVEPAHLPTSVATPTEAGRAVGLADPWGPATRIDPLFRVVAEPGDAVWATFEDGSPAVVVRRGEHGAEAYIAVPALTPELLRALARMAGVHLITQTNAAVWTHGKMLCLHAMSDGPLPLTIPGAGNVVDVYRGTTLGVGPAVTIDTRHGETYLLTWD